MARTTRWLTIPEAAEQACCEPREVRRAVRRGHLRAIRTRGNGLRVLESWVDEWLANQLLPEHDGGDGLVDTARLSRELSAVILEP
jgi:excisionase family DNA binding protein